MSRPDLERDVVALLRRTVLLGADREIALDVPLGATGLGLDSLGMMELVLGLETAFGVRFPATFWSDRGQLSLRQVVDFLAVARPEGRSAGAAPADATTSEAIGSERSEGASAHVAQRLHELADEVRARGVWRGLAWSAGRLVGRYARWLYARATQLLLARDVTEAIPEPAASIELAFREATLAESQRLAELWPGTGTEALLADFRRRFGRGDVCLVAEHRDRIVGFCWLSTRSAGATALSVTAAPGTCFGLNLVEHPRYRHLGVGLGLLAFSLAETRRRGYRRQVTLVGSWNRNMLLAAIQGFGFRSVGTLTTTWLLGRPHTGWKLDAGGGGRGGVLEI